MEASISAADRITGQQLHEAREGLVRLLHKKRFPREWIEREVPDAMAEAEKDLAARLAAGKEDNTVNLLVVIAYRRAIKMLRAQLAKPTTSLEAVLHLADESTPSPVAEAIRHDRHERIMEAMRHLPERERMLLTLCYFNGMSIREAGRRVGWGKSSADRHHRAALEKLKALLDPNL
jgi:RNA polymerase sigma factor (sigma-70 family)